MTVETASKKLNMSAQAVRTLMRKGRLPVGICIRNEGRWQYVIYEAWIEKFLSGEPVIIPEGMSDKE